MIYSVKRFSAVASGKILNTRQSSLGFDRTRKYDTDLDRLGRVKTAQGELGKTGQLRDEMRKLSQELKNAKDD